MRREIDRPSAPELLWIRTRALPVLTLVALFLLPWTVWLTVTLPSRHVSEHWDAAWVGFDTAEMLAIAATVVGIYRRALWVEVTAAIAGTLLLADAWFDVLLSGDGGKTWIAIAEAALAEVPLALLCFSVAFDLSRFLSRWAAVLRVAPAPVRDRLLHLAAPGEGAPECDLVRVLEVAPDREAAREARHTDAAP